MDFHLSEESKFYSQQYQIPLEVPQLDTEQDFSDKPIILIRHGFSMQNFQEKEITYKNPSWEYSKTEGLEEMFTSEKYIDSSLHEIGIFQCIQQQKSINKFKFYTVFISPLRRTIQTCIYLFATHPDRQNIKFVLLPQLAECLCSSGCFSAFTLSQTRKEMEALAQKYQISLDYSRVSELGESWQIKVLENDQIVKNILEKLERNGECGYRQPYHKIILDEIKQTKNYLIESWEMLYKKSKRAQEIIKHFLESAKQQQIQNGQDDSEYKVGIVSHGYLMKCMTASRIEDNGSVQEGIVLQNVQILPYSFD
ncbi:histidine phosphatase family (branch protein 1) (macronuclear) [Tetrahymena thermophila SB210]|uniref:Histidine phosphatase family (Branch protein 1) n=1 Tax=Tetrahymena thermophila (strain SB210) TaxID=312017 RepID=Q22VX8_TETTS|nr:histidine phosphatase family (branch protein 1) [Tetrahymena thermophila SB210]EAR89638.3 histidine phosphatase family (branch protein 1) [Tetrahymena thermophila SB210]|eukprot:XP_001009884.3 histidine phosphatase family (branch protein 1) [Tetrahymena thermophila SB210]